MPEQTKVIGVPVRLHSMPQKMVYDGSNRQLLPNCPASNSGRKLPSIKSPTAFSSLIRWKAVGSRRS
jgi:hypothetical protein